MNDKLFNVFIIVVGLLFVGVMAYFFYLGIFGKKFEDVNKKDSKTTKNKA